MIGEAQSYDALAELKRFLAIVSLPIWVGFFVFLVFDAYKSYRFIGSDEWPKVIATVTNTSFRQVFGRHMPFNPAFRVELRFGYETNNHRYKSTLLEHNDAVFTKKNAEYYVNRHRVGTQLTIGVSPKNPSLICLKYDQKLSISSVLFGVAIVGFFVLAFLLSLFRGFPSLKSKWSKYWQKVILLGTRK